jgi:hypothetical protein
VTGFIKWVMVISMVTVWGDGTESEVLDLKTLMEMAPELLGI